MTSARSAAVMAASKSPAANFVLPSAMCSAMSCSLVLTGGACVWCYRRLAWLAARVEQHAAHHQQHEQAEHRQDDLGPRDLRNDVRLVARRRRGWFRGRTFRRGRRGAALAAGPGRAVAGEARRPGTGIGGGPPIGAPPGMSLASIVRSTGGGGAAAARWSSASSSNRNMPTLTGRPGSSVSRGKRCPSIQRPFWLFRSMSANCPFSNRSSA